MDQVTNKRRAKIIFFIVVLFSFLGYRSFVSIPDQLEPTTTNDLVAVQIALPGVSAEKIEKDVLESLEQELSQLDGV